jgi:c-di-GMP-binding flagellar brake protein YcgR
LVGLCQEYDSFTIFYKGALIKTVEEEAKPRYGIADFERGTYRRFPIRLPIEYYRAPSPINQTGQTLDANEGGLQILFPEQVDIGQNLKLKLFFSSESELNTIEMLVEVVWVNTPLGEGEKQYRSGVRFINISPEDMTKLKTFSASLL